MRQNTHKNKRINTSWRKPQGKHSDQRLKKKNTPAMPQAGLRTPKDERGLHPSGYEDVLVHRPEDLEDLNSEEEAARIGSTVGGKKREMILEKAEELDLKVLNPGEEE
ncbi:MAG: 50S ribosomal protein L32e [Candidatus Nanohaloarchaea archaeon]